MTGDAVTWRRGWRKRPPPGEVLLGGGDARACRAAVDVEPVEPLELKGKAKRVPAYRLVPCGRARAAHEASFVGRERELALLREAWERVVRSSAASW